MQAQGNVSSLGGRIDGNAMVIVERLLVLAPPSVPVPGFLRVRLNHLLIQNCSDRHGPVPFFFLPLVRPAGQ